MGISSQLYSEPATKGDVAGVAIKMSVALMNIVIVLNRIKSGKEIPEEKIEYIKTLSDELEDIFDDLSGWRDEKTDADK